MTRLVIGIETCQKYAKKREAVRRTWYPDCRKMGVSAYFLVGRPGKPAEIQGDTLYLDCGDGYLDLPAKTVAFLEYVRRNLDFDHVFKCDDDTYVNVERLVKLPYKDYDYFGFLIDPPGIATKWHYRHVEPELRKPYEGKKIGPWLSGGTGYFLSKRAVELVLSSDRAKMTGEIYEDKLIGDIMTLNHASRGNVGYYRDPGDHQSLGLMNYYVSFQEVFLSKRSAQGAVDFATMHPCAPREMHWIRHMHNPFMFSMVRFFHSLSFLAKRN